VALVQELRGRTSFSSDKVSIDHFSGPGTAIGLVCVCLYLGVAVCRQYAGNNV